MTKNKDVQPSRLGQIYATKIATAASDNEVSRLKQEREEMLERLKAIVSEAVLDRMSYLDRTQREDKVWGKILDFTLSLTENGYLDEPAVFARFLLDDSLTLESAFGINSHGLLKKKTAEQDAKILLEHQRGTNYSSIATIIGVDRATVAGVIEDKEKFKGRQDRAWAWLLDKAMSEE